jgi:hypothetical protein
VPRTSKKKSKPAAASSSGGFNIFDEPEAVDTDGDEDLPKDEIGRQKIKQQYIDLLGIRIQKLKGRILNRERINKTLEGIYFICSRCMKVCHNLDEGLVEDEENANNICVPCSQAGQQLVQVGPSPKHGPAKKKKKAVPAAPAKAAKAPGKKK